jgi:RNA polymerase sigma-70 factor (ECF subfamily)
MSHEPHPESDHPPLSAEDEATYVQLIHGAQPVLLRYVMSLVGNRDDAEDVLQRASVTMWRRFDTFDQGSDFIAWATTVAFYEVRNFQRVTGRSRLKFDDDLMNTLAAERANQLSRHRTRFDALQECVAELPSGRRELVEAVYTHGEDVATVAKRVGRATQTVYNRLSAIRQVLAECVQRKLETA